MNFKTIRLFLWVAVVVAAFVAGGFAVYVRFVKEPAAGQTASRPITGIGGPFSLVDQNGKPFTEATLVGQPTAMFFGYTHCPDVCPTTLGEAQVWLADLGPAAEKLRFVFVTVDPERDTPAMLKDYLFAFGERFIGLSGTREQLNPMLKAYHVVARKVADPKGGDDYTMDHTAAIYLIDAKGQFTGIINYQEETSKAEAKLKALIGG